MKMKITKLAAFWLSLVVFGLVTSSPAAAQTTNRFARWEKDIAAFEMSDRTNPPPQNGILFIGSSSIRLWTNLAKDFPGKPVINRGFGGSEIADSVHFADRIVIPYRPRLIVMYAGGNDINAKKTPERVAADFKAFVEKVHKALPETRIAYISIAPNPARWAQVENVRKANQMIREYTETDARLAFIDVFTPMLGEDGTPSRDIYRPDRLHMNEKGYSMWKEIIAPYLDGRVWKAKAEK